MVTLKRCCIMFVVALLAPVNAVQAESEGQQQLLFFLSGGPTSHHIVSEEGIQKDDILLDADILYSYLKGDFRFLAEYILSTEESELERFQFGWQAEEETIIWLGRFHSPSRYWNSTYHHGQYLQTSITRPLVEKFEDEGGILPAHVTGIMLETSRRPLAVNGFQSTISLGAAPVIGDSILNPYDLLNASSDHRASVDLRLAYLPDPLGENQFGLTMNWSNLVVDDSLIAQQQGLKRVEQSVFGAYIDWGDLNWRALMNLTYIANQMKKQVQSQTDTFTALYLQAEYSFSLKWKVFGRVEDTAGVGDSDYFELFPSAVLQREMLGMRFDFYRNNALTFEVSNVKTQSDEFDQLWLQWSAVFP